MNTNHMIIKGKWIVTLERLYTMKYLRHANLCKLGIQALVKSGIAIPVDREANDPDCTLSLTTDGEKVLGRFFNKKQIIRNKQYIHKNIGMVIILLMLGIMFLILNHLIEPVMIDFPIAPRSYTYHHFTYTKSQVKAIKHLQNQVPYIRQQFEDPYSIWFDFLNIGSVLIAISFIITLCIFIAKGIDHQCKIDSYNYDVSLKLTINRLRDLIDKNIQLNWNSGFISMYDADIRTHQIPTYIEPHPNEHLGYYLTMY